MTSVHNYTSRPRIEAPSPTPIFLNFRPCTYIIYISYSTYSRINSEPLNRVSGFSLISVSKDLPIVSCLFENFSNNRSFYI